MSVMEDSLRRALEAGDAGDPAFRESIYAASERALERMLQLRETSDADALAQRTRLAETIDRVEADYAGLSGQETAYAEPGLDEPAIEENPHGEGYHPGADAAYWQGGPDAADPRTPRSFDPADASEAEAANWTPGGERHALGGARSKPRSPFVVPIAAVIFAALLAVLAYVIGGAIRGESAPVGAGTEETSSLDWISVFDGNDLENLSTPNGGRIESTPRSGGRDAVRISAPAGGDGEVLLSVGPGTVRSIAGSNVRIELTAGSPDGASREFAIRCLFGQDSVCERQRFSTTMGEEAFIFDVPIPAGAATPASIAIAPGVSGTPSDVDIYSVRIRRLS